MARETLAQAQARANAAEQALAEHKAKVVEVAHKYAEDHDWCSVVNDALRELGLGAPRIEVTLTITDPKALLEVANQRSDYPLNDFMQQDGTVRPMALETALQWAIEGVDAEDVVEVDRNSIRVLTD